jgi:hypothetical protein
VSASSKKSCEVNSVPRAPVGLRAHLEVDVDRAALVPARIDRREVDVAAGVADLVAARNCWPTLRCAETSE